jgi:hypothetical protein
VRKREELLVPTRRLGKDEVLRHETTILGRTGLLAIMDELEPLLRRLLRIRMRRTLEELWLHLLPRRLLPAEEPTLKEEAIHRR